MGLASIKVTLSSNIMNFISSVSILRMITNINVTDVNMILSIDITSTPPPLTSSATRVEPLLYIRVFIPSKAHALR